MKINKSQKSLYGIGLILVIGLLFNTQPALSEMTNGDVPSANNYRAVGYFDAKKLLEVEWFEVIYANINPSAVQGCSMYRFAAQDRGAILYQNGYYVPGINGDFEAFNATVKQVGHTGQFKKIDEPGYGLYVLDHADNFDWIILADSSSLGDFITLFSKDRRRKDVIDLAINFFKKYSQNSHHLSLQSSKCSYNDVWKQLRKLEKTA